MKLKFLATLTVALAVTMVHFAFADQLDDEAAATAARRSATDAPAAVMVKVDPSKHTVEVYRVPHIDERVVNRTASSDLTEGTIRRAQARQNLIATFTLSTNELDSGSSTGACWFGRWYGRGWGWNNWGGYGYGYYPYSYYGGYGAYYYPSYYNWYSPYSYYPGYFSYGAYRYGYGYSYPYFGSMYGWYY